jgi:hypothetical protein
MRSCIDFCSKVLVDGYISHTFTPRQAERYFIWLLKTNLPHCPSRRIPGIDSTFFHTPSVPGYISNQAPDQSRWVLDRGILNMGTVVPQTLWVPHTQTDLRNHVELARLQLPIFFQCIDGRLGLPLEAAASGRCHSLADAQISAPLGDKSTTHFRIIVSGIFNAVFCSVN